MLKKLAVIVLLILLLVAGFYIFKNKKHSKIITEYSVKQGKDSFVVTVPKASLPKEQPVFVDYIIGRVQQIPNDPKNPNSEKITVVKSAEEATVVTNIPYVHTLKIFYDGQSVKLHGKKRKNVVIHGIEYKSFWIEDIDVYERSYPDPK